MTFTSIDASWWPFVFIILAAALPTMVWRWAAVFFAADLDAESEWLVLVRCISTALVAAVVAQFIIFPTGALADFPLLLRVGAAVAGFLVFLRTQELIRGVLFAEGVLIVCGWVLNVL